MKMTHALTAVAAFGLVFGAAQANDQFKQTTTYVPNSGSAIHSGGMSAEDTALADSVAAALAADAKLKTGITVTVAAKNGRVSLAGSARDYSLAARAEKVASDVAGRANVSGTLDGEGA
jgi:osmotically-inducible protein OsmY